MVYFYCIERIYNINIELSRWLFFQLFHSKVNLMGEMQRLLTTYGMKIAAFWNLYIINPIFESSTTSLRSESGKIVEL